MLDFVNEICTPAKVYFAIMILIFIFSMITGRLSRQLFLNLKNKLSKKEYNLIKAKIFPYIIFTFVISFIIFVVITLVFNYFCSLGYTNIVGIVVAILILNRCYKFYKNGF